MPLDLTELPQSEPQKREGRPTLANKEVAQKILKYMAQGNYLKPSCEAAGVSYAAMREWIAKAARDRDAGLQTSPYIEFTDQLKRAEAAAEAALVERLNTAEDWRAQSFILERRHRERWGKTEQQQQPQQVLVLSEELAAGMLEALRAAARSGDQNGDQQAQVIDSTATTKDSVSHSTVDAEYEQLEQQPTGSGSSGGGGG